LKPALKRLRSTTEWIERVWASCAAYRSRGIRLGSAQERRSGPQQKGVLKIRIDNGAGNCLQNDLIRRVERLGIIATHQIGRSRKRFVRRLPLLGSNIACSRRVHLRFPQGALKAVRHYPCRCGATQDRETGQLSRSHIFHAGILSPSEKRLAASRRAPSAICAYRAVVWGSVCPSNLPTMCRDSPLDTRWEANVWRRS